MVTMNERSAQAGSQPAPATWVPVRAQMHDHAMTVADVPASKFYRDASTFVETYRDVAAYYGVDIASPVGDDYNYEVEAMGAKMIYGENSMPTIDFRDPLIKQPEDLYKLKTPDFRADGRLPYALECMKLRGGTRGTFCGVFSMAVGLRSYPAVVKDMRKRPEFAHDLFTFIVDRVLIPYLKVQREDCGISAANGSEAWVSVPSLSVKEMHEWILPYYKRLVSKAADFGVRVVPGGGDYSEEDPAKFDPEVVKGAFDFQMFSRGGNFLTLGMGAWHLHPLEVVREYTAPYRARGTRITITAGVNARILRDGPVEKIVSVVKRYVDAFARDHDLIILLANIPADTRPEHVHAAIAATHTYGRIPIAGNLEGIDFRAPQRETYQQWRTQQPRAAR
ncbi:MAG: hypothetical protein HYY32_02655 [Chloroflexi bacterium]|nr:hypothetical protein [Chloroflexota bacterium]